MSHHPSAPPPVGFMPYPSNQPPYAPQPGYPPAYNQHQQAHNPHQSPPNHHQPFPAPIQHQPGFGSGSSSVQHWYSNTDYSAYLRDAASFHVKQSVELLEAVIGWETPNKFTIKDQSGNKVFVAVEESGCLGRQCFGNRRPFHISLKDMRGANILNFERDLDCGCFCGMVCPDSMAITTASGQLLGKVVEDAHLFYPKFIIQDSSGRTIFTIEGPMCALSVCPGQSVVFRVLNASGVSVGTISKEWSGWARELFTDADYFSMSFPVDLDPSLKAVCLGALFLIDMEYFEAKGSRGDQGGRRLFS